MIPEHYFVHRPRSTQHGGRMSIGEEHRTRRNTLDAQGKYYVAQNLRRKVHTAPVIETIAVKFGPLTLPKKRPKIALDANGILRAVVTESVYQTYTAVRA